MASSPKRWMSSGSSAAVSTAALEPGPALGPDELRRLRQRARGDARVDRGVQQLGHRAVQLGPAEGEVVRHHPVGGHGHGVEPDGAAGGGALPHAVPVVDDRDARGVPRHVRDVQRRRRRRRASTGIQSANSAPVE